MTRSDPPWGRIGPWCLGGEFLPPLYDSEVEIARISLASTTSDQISVRAHRQDGLITYRIVGEYEEDESMRYELPFAQSEQPLTLAELIDLIEGAVIPGCAYPGGLCTSHWLMMNEYCEDAQEIIGFLSLNSPFYPQLDACYQALGLSWIEENREPDEEE